MRILLLGASGLLGHNVLKQLLELNHSVVVLVRHSNAIHLENSHSYETLIGSLLDYHTLAKAAAGCDAIVNCAGTTNMALLHYEDYLPVNSHLCDHLLQLSFDLNIRTLIHVSTANTIGYGTSESLADESAPMQPPFSQSFYALSKQEGEEKILQAATLHPDNHFIVVNPGFMVGAYDIKPSSGKLLMTGYRKPLMAVPKGGKSFISVSDAATAICNAIYHGINGQRYLLTGENMTLKAFYELQAQTMGYQQKCLTLPDWLVRFAGKLGDLLRTLGIKTQLSTRNVNQLLVCEYYSAQKAQSDLLMPSTPIATAIQDFWKYQNEKF